MSKQASPTLIGTFVAGAIGLIVAGILIISGGKLLTTDKTSYMLYFQGSVKGHGISSPVFQTTDSATLVIRMRGTAPVDVLWKTSKGEEQNLDQLRPLNPWWMYKLYSVELPERASGAIADAAYQS